MARKSTTFNFGNKSSSSKMEVIEVVCNDVGVDTEDEIIQGEEVASFSFVSASTPSSKSIPTINPAPKSEYRPNVLPLSSSPNNEIKHHEPRSVHGSTPTIDGESFTIKRTYNFRPSIVRKLSELKANHPDVNVYMTTILDEAIMLYYNTMLLQNGFSDKM